MAAAQPISVVVPLYNKAAHIRRALSSILAQSVTDFECIVVDDGSTDPGAEIVESISDPRVRLIRQANRGVSAARNRGVSESRYSMVAFLDADDEWKHYFLEAISALILDMPTCGAYATAYTIVEPQGTEWPVRLPSLPPHPWSGILTNYFRAAQYDPPVCASAVCLRKEALIEIGMFPLGERLGEDLDTWCRLALDFPIAYTTACCARYHRESSNRACDHRPHDHEYRLIETLDLAIRGVRRTARAEGHLISDLIEYRNKKLIECAAANVVAFDTARARFYLRGSATTRAWQKQWWFWYVLSGFPSSLLRGAVRVRRNLRKLTTWLMS